MCSATPVAAQWLLQGIRNALCAELDLLSQLEILDLAENILSWTLPSSWAGLNKASCAAYNVLNVQLL